jgi:2-C-methyl-D-erythritol 4-phosphate cytidylyltransferase
MDIAMIPGDEGNFKITTQDDLERMRAIVYESMGITRYKRF